MQRKKELNNIKSSFLISLSGSFYQNVPQNELDVDYFSYFNRIITPNIRVANDSLLTDAERMEINQVAKLMCNYGITFSQEMEFDPKTHIRTLNYKLDPYVFKNYVMIHY